MSNDRSVIHKVPVYSIEGLLGLKDGSPSARDKSSETVIQKTASTEMKAAPSASSAESEKLRNGKKQNIDTIHIRTL